MTVRVSLVGSSGARQGSSCSSAMLHLLVGRQSLRSDLPKGECICSCMLLHWGMNRTTGQARGTAEEPQMNSHEESNNSGCEIRCHLVHVKEGNMAAFLLLISMA